MTPVRTALDVDGIEAVLAQHGAPNPARIVDLGCGDGRIAVALSVRGHHVTGLDYSASMLAAARDRAAQFGTYVELVEADMRAAHEHVTGVDVALSWFSSFGYFDETADDLAALESARATLAPGGVLLLEMQHRDRVAALHADSSPQRLYEERPDGIVLRELWFDPVRGRAGEHVRQLRADGTAEDRAVLAARLLRHRAGRAVRRRRAGAGGRLRRPRADAVRRLDAPARGREARRVILAPLLSIPSPSDPLISEIGIIKLRWYGTLIAIGILIAGLARVARARPPRLPARPGVHHRHVVHPGRRDRRAAVPRRHRLGPVQRPPREDPAAAAGRARACPA